MKIKLILLVIVLLLPCAPQSRAVVKQWDGSSSGNWSVAANWTNGVAPVDGDDVIFPGGASNPTSTNNIADLRLKSLTFTATGYVLRGNPISLTNGLSNTAIGIGNDTIAFAITNGADQTFSCADSRSSLTLSSNILLGGHMLTVTGGGDTAMNGVVSGTGGLIKSGTGALTLSGTNTYTAGTFIDAGLVNLSNGSGLGLTSGTTIISNGATLQLLNNITVAEPMTLSGTLDNGSGSNTISGGIALLANSTVLVETNTALTLANVLSGPGALVKIGPGRLTLSGIANNTYSGATTVNDGTLALNKTSGINAIPGALTIGDGSGATNSARVQLVAANQIPDSSAVTIDDDGWLDLNGNSEAINSLTVIGGGVATGAGTLTLGGDVTANASTNTATISGNLSLGSATRTFNIGSGTANPDLTISAVISGNAGVGITKTGTGFLLLSGTNTYSGLTTVTTAFLEVANPFALGSTSSGTTLTSGGALLLINVTVAGETLTSSGLSSLLQSSGAAGWSGNIVLNTTLQISVVSVSGTNDISGVISGTAGFVKTSSGPLILSGPNDNTYAGTTTVNTGTLLLNKSASKLAIAGALIIGDGSGGANADVVRLLAQEQIFNPAAVTVTNSGLLDLNNHTETIGSLAGTSGSTCALAGGNLSAGADNTSTVFAGTFSGTSASGLVKAGAGTMTLSGNSAATFFGTTTVIGGTLRVDGSIQDSPVGVTAGILGGTGTVGTINAISGGTVSPGDSPGILNSSNVTLAGSAAFSVELNGTNAGTDYDQLNVTGTVSLGSATFNLSLGFTPVLSNSFTIIKNDLADGVTGTFGGKPEGTVFPLGGEQFRISYVGGDGNDVVLTQLTNNSTNRPSLTIESIPPNSVRLLWPTQSSDFNLQTNANLSSNTWGFDSSLMTIVGTNFVVTNIISRPQLFYRLIHD